MNNLSNLLIILTGKTASGKDTIMAGLLSCFPAFRKVITTTSRNIRPEEKNGVDYYFLSETQFKQKIKEGLFIEYVEYAGNLYGTEKSQILDNLGRSSLIWRIDPSRAGRIRQLIKDSFEPAQAEDLLRKVLVIYLTVEDKVILERLKKRGLNPEEIEKRMQEDSRFWNQFKDNYDFVVENIPGDLKGTLDKVTQILDNHRS